MSVKAEVDDEPRSVSPDDAPDQASAPTELSKDEIFFALSNHRRRYVLHYLKQVDDELVELSELSEHVAAWDNGIPVGETTSTQRKRAYVSLRQTHLPKMNELGIIDFDTIRGTTQLAARAEDLEFYLEVNEKDELPWSGLYFGLGTLMSLLTGAIWLGIPPFTVFPTIPFMMSMALLFTLVALAHVFQSERMRIGNDRAPPPIP